MWLPRWSSAASSSFRPCPSSPAPRCRPRWTTWAASSPPGVGPREIAGLIEAGLDGRAVIASATTAVDGPASRDRGVLAAGFSADIIGVHGDPLTQPLDLCEVDFVMRGGRVVLGPKEP